MLGGSYPLDCYIYWSTCSAKNHTILCEYFSFSVQVQFSASLFRQKENIYLISEAGATLNEWQTKCHKSFTWRKVITSWYGRGPKLSLLMCLISESGAVWTNGRHCNKGSRWQKVIMWWKVIFGEGPTLSLLSVSSESGAALHEWQFLS